MIPITASVIGGSGSNDAPRARVVGLTLTYVLGMALLYATLGLVAGLSGQLFGTIGATRVLGVPGNPVSTLVCATMFLRPAIDTMLGRLAEPEPQPTALLGRDLPENDSRDD